MGLEFTRQTQAAIEKVRELLVVQDGIIERQNTFMDHLRTLNSAVIDLQTRVEQLERANANRQRPTARSN